MARAHPKCSNKLAGSSVITTWNKGCSPLPWRFVYRKCGMPGSPFPEPIYHSWLASNNYI